MDQPFSQEITGMILWEIYQFRQYEDVLNFFELTAIYLSFMPKKNIKCIC